LWQHHRLPTENASRKLIPKKKQNPLLQIIKPVLDLPHPSNESHHPATNRKLTKLPTSRPLKQPTNQLPEQTVEASRPVKRRLGIEIFAKDSTNNRSPSIAKAYDCERFQPRNYLKSSRREIGTPNIGAPQRMSKDLGALLQGGTRMGFLENTEVIIHFL